MKKVHLVGIWAVIVLLLISNMSFSQETKPPISATSYSVIITIGEKFEYKIEPKMSDSALKLEFELRKGPDGMTLDPKTGIILWSPTVKGEYAAEYLIYYVKENVKIKASAGVLKLRVVDFKGTIKGTVKAADGTLLPKITIAVYSKVQAEGKPDSYKLISSGYTDAEGKYLVTLYEEGLFYLQAVSRSEMNSSGNKGGAYQSIWYKDALSVANALIIPINKTASEFTADFTLIKNPNQPVVTFSASATAVKNQPFKYLHTFALPKNWYPVEYKLEKAPEGMNINTQSGQIEWTPGEKGDFVVEIGIFSNSVKVGLLYLKINVVDFLGSLSGTIINDEGVPLKGIYVVLYKNISVSQKEGRSDTSFTAISDEKGNYIIENITPGEYYLYARPNIDKMLNPADPNSMYMPVWYKAAATMDKADVIVIAQTLVKVEANLTMHKIVKKEPVVFTVTGTVTDASTGKGVAEALVFAAIPVVAESIEKGLLIGLSLTNYVDKNIGLMKDIVAKAVTDQEGKYAMKVRAEIPLVFSCYSPNHEIQYFDNKASALEADKITLTGDKTDINFKLNQLPEAKAKISGKIVDETGAPVEGKVILYPYLAKTKSGSVRTTDTNGNGEFVFEKVLNGKYFILAVPNKNYVPSYFKTNACGVNSSSTAEAVEVKNDDDVSGVSICVKKRSATGGGKISGMVVDAGGTGIGGVIVIAESGDNTDCSFAVTESNGFFEIPELGVGSYKVTADKFGYNSIVKEGAAIDYSKSVFNSSINLVLTENSLTEVNLENEIPSEFILYQNYPNPFNPSTIIKFAVPKQDRVMLKVYDLLGKEIAVLVDRNLSAGVHEANFDAAGLPSGFYVYRLITSNYTSSRKMLLIK